MLTTAPRPATGREADSTVPAPRASDSAASVRSAGDIAVFADFTDPYSYLAALRVDRLLGAGLATPNWRSVVSPRVELTSRRPGTEEQQARDRALADALSLIGPGEQLAPGRLPDRTPVQVPHTAAATAAYAEACGVGAGDVARRLIFAAYWVDGLDIGNAGVLRSLLMGPVREAISRRAYGTAGHRPPMHPEPMEGVWAPAPRAGRAAQTWRGSAEVITWAGNTVSPAGGPITTAGDRRVRRWQAQWRELDAAPGLTMVVDGRVLHGAEAVDYLASLR